MTRTKREDVDLLKAQLENERASFLPHWRELGDYIFPRRPQFSVSENNKGDRRNQKIIDATATMAARTLRSGMMSGITSPARPWFRLTTPDPGMMERGPVKVWLHDVTEIMTTVFARTNLYNALPVVYGDMGAFGTAALLVEEDAKKIMNFEPLPIGSYMISVNASLEVDTYARDFQMKVRNIVERFGRDAITQKINWEKVSPNVKELWDSGRMETQVDVTHVVRPNPDFNPIKGKTLPKYKRYESLYFEKSRPNDRWQKKEFLGESGYDFFPVLCPRWEVNGECAYGIDCPGMTSLGDNKGLQIMQKRKAQAIEKMVNPPMVGPSTLANTKASILPGDITYLDEIEGRRGFRPIHEVNPQIQPLLLDIQDHQKRISRAFYEDLFLMMSQSDRREITAREIDERREEKLLALGPVLEQLNQDLLDPLIDNAFDILERRGLIPEPPKDVQGLSLKVEYISIMAQSQKLIGLASIERFTSFVGNVATQTQNPTVLDKIDLDQLIDVYADLTSVPPGIVRPDENVEAIRQQRQKAQQAATQQQALQQASMNAKSLSETKLDGNNALTKLIEQAQAGSLT